MVSVFEYSELQYKNHLLHLTSDTLSQWNKARVRVNSCAFQEHVLYYYSLFAGARTQNTRIQNTLFPILQKWHSCRNYCVNISQIMIFRKEYSTLADTRVKLKNKTILIRCHNRYNQYLEYLVNREFVPLRLIIDQTADQQINV